MFRPIKGGVRPPWSSSAQSLRGKEKDKDVERAAPGESQKPSGLNKAFVVASQPDKIATAQCASKVIQIRIPRRYSEWEKGVKASDSDEDGYVAELLRSGTSPKKTHAGQKLQEGEGDAGMDCSRPVREGGSDEKTALTGGSQEVVETKSNVSDTREAEILQLWRREVPLATSKLGLSWEPWSNQAILTRLLASKEEIFKLQRKAGLNRDLQLEAQFNTASRLATLSRPNSISNDGYVASKYEAFCLENNIPLFPVTEAITLLYFASTTRLSTLKATAKKGRLTNFRNIFNGTATLWAEDDTFLELSCYAEVGKALLEWIHYDATSQDRSNGQNSTTQSTTISAIAGSSPAARTEQASAGTQSHYVFPAAAVGYAGFTDAHFSHYHELQLIQRNDAAWARLAKATTKQEPSRRLSEPTRKVTKSPSPNPEVPPLKRPRFSLDGKRDPFPAPDPADGQEASLKSHDPPKVESPPPPPVVSDPSASSSELPVEQPEPEKQASPIIETSNSTNPDSKPWLEAPQPEQPNPSPAPSTSTALHLSPQPPPRPKPRSSRVSLLAQSALSSPVVDTPIPLSIDSLRTFLSSLSSSLAFLAEPLHSSGLDTFEVLSLFAAFEVDTRIRMVVLACQRAGVEVKEEHLETLEGAIENARETDWA